MIKIVSKEIPHAYRNKYLRASGNTVVISGGVTTSGNASGGSGTGDLDISVFAQRDEANIFTKENIFKGGIAIDNPAPSLIIKRNTVQVATLGYDASKLCVSLSSTEANKGLNLFDDGRFEFGGRAVYHAGNSNLNTVEWSAKTLFSNVLKAANQAELVKYDGTNTVLGALAGTTTIQSKAADLLHSKGGANYIIWDASNSNLNSVDWKAKNIFAKDYVQNDNFVSGYTGTGCRISADGKAECTDLWVRGTMNVYELIVNKINATNGALAVSDTGKVATVSGSTLTLTGDNDNMNTFRVGDVLKCQRFTGKNVKLYFLTVTAITGLNVTFTYRSGGSGANTVAAGDVLVRWNSSDANRKGLLYLTASDSQAPYMDVLYNEQVRLRLGRLDGIADSAFPASTQPSGFGLYAQNAFLKGVFILTSGKTVDGEITVASNKANAAQSTANNAQSTANGAKSAADAAQSTANSAQTAANNANNAITTIRTELSAVDGKITLAVNESKTYTNNSINNLQIGNRNFARYTANLKTYTLSTGAGSLGYPTKGFKKGDVITVSFEIDMNIPSWTSGTKMLQFDNYYNYMSFYNFPSGDNKKGWLKRTAQLTINNVYNSTNATTEEMTSNPYMRMDNASTELANGGYVKVRNFKVEKGNKATDWTPAPEDMAQDAQDKANAALNAAKTYTNSEISVVNGKINLKVDSSTFNALGNRVSAAETRITQTENSIKLKADQTTVNGINSRLQSAEAKITPDAIRLTVKDQATQLANTAANNAVNGLQIGGRNLARGTSNEWRSFPITNGVNICWNGYGGSVYIDGEKISTNDTIIVSFDVKYSNMKKQVLGSGEAYRCILQGSGNVTGWSSGIPGYDLLSQINFSTGTGEFHVSYSFKLNSTQLTNTRFDTNIRHDRLTGTLSVRNFKAEKGNKATNWSGAPEDYSTTEQIKSQFTMDANGISMLGKKISLAGMVAFSSLNSDVQNKINTANTNATNALNRKIGLAQMDTTVISGGYIKTSLINTDGLVAKKISAATGTFERLDAANGKGYVGLDGNGITIAATSDNVVTVNSKIFWVYGDMYSQGQTAGRSNRFYASNIRCRGSLGFTQLNTLVLKGSYGFYYPNGYGASALTVYFTRKTASTGEAYYEVPVYGGPNSESEISGFPVNLIVFSWSGNTTRYTYNFTMAAPGQVIHLFNANDASSDDTRCYFVNGKRGWIMGGGARNIIAISPADLYPAIATDILGRGWMEGPSYDNNWR